MPANNWIILPEKESLGGKLGRSLGESLTALANVKLQGIQKRNQAHGLMALGYTPEQATQLSQLPEELLKPIVTNASRSLSSINKPSSKEFFKRFLPNLSDEDAKAIDDSPANVQLALFKTFLENPELNFGAKNTTTPEQEPSAVKRLQDMQSTNLTPENNILKTQPAQSIQPIQPTVKPTQTPVAAENIKKTAEKALTPGEILAKGLTESKKEKQLKAEEKERRKEEHFEKKAAKDLANKQALEAQKNKNRLILQDKKEKADLDKFNRKEKVRQEEATYKKSEDEKKHIQHAFEVTKDYRKQMDLSQKAARQALATLDRMEELNQKGTLDGPGYVNMLKEAGYDMAAFLSADSQEFQKLSLSFLRGLKDIFGGNVAVQEMETFLQQVPTLSQSPEGRQRVIANMKRIYRQDDLLTEIQDKIIEDHNDIPPQNLDILVKKAANNKDPKSKYYNYHKKLVNIGEQFKRDLEKPVPQGENKFITGLLTGAGKVVGKTGKIVGGIVGKAVGGVPGAVIGTLAG
jgi:hypothetical protein